ncbi:phage tail protein [Pasteurella atlantica]|uniref:Phage tail protein n=2 Tax=Pasteurellaceae TaxID=712 RepID=A0ACC6HJW2_9PAST|nr:phage tail protein [Pasteurella atlantica]MDP8051049.1 phage tail protein [Pasteurella atlantica]MDP8104345.1 phage tail protein [Pasteurella atlantica]MDP8147705.1 phage tail protein [Pasteurella atlantica]
MPSEFDTLLKQTDSSIEKIIMAECVINGEKYSATYDENPTMAEFLSRGDEPRINGTERALTLFRSSGYKPKAGHQVKVNERNYVVQSYAFQDGLIILQLE